MKNTHRLLLSLIFCLTALANLYGGDHSIAPMPPMGWNSWDSYGQTIDEKLFKANTDWMAKNLRRFGWHYMVIDEGWYIENLSSDPKDYKFVLSKDGRFLPVPARFPSAAGDAGFKPLVDYVHGLGLKFGIHMLRGIPREAVAKNLPIADSSFHAADAADPSDACPWNIYNWGVKNNPAGQAYYDSVAKLYASWGVDFIKVDCIANNPYKPDEIRMIHNAIKKSGRQMLLSLSPGPTAIEHAAEVAKYSEMWRICNDFWDHWGPWEKHEWSQGLFQQFATTAMWASHIAPGSWPDADMIPIGHLGPNPGAGEPRDTRFTKDEQRTLMTLWSISRSPLMMGGDLLALNDDDWTTSLLTNPDVIEVNQHSKGNRALITNDTTAVWVAQPEEGKAHYLAIFNIGDKEQDIHYEWKDVGLPGANYSLHDLWEDKDFGPLESLIITLRPHASVLYKVE
jgi:alpha-galactosidase